MSGGEQQHKIIKPPQSSAANFLMLNQALLTTQHGNLQTLVDSSPAASLQNSFQGLPVGSSTVYTLHDNQLRLPVVTATTTKGDESGDKTETKVDLYSINEDKGVTGLAVVTIPFQDGGREQTSPETPSHQSSSSQILHYRPSAKSGDAMLSAINYNDSEMLQEGAFDSLPNLDDSILSNMGTPGTIRLSENPYPDLFDGEGNVNDSYSMEGLSPQPFQDSTQGFVGENNLGSVMDSDGIPNTVSDPSKLGDSSKQKKPKNKQPKGQGSPARQNMQCPTCSKMFNNSSALAKHRLTHSDERKYVCNLCHKAFKRQDHLNGHLMTHRDKKPYECNVDSCQKSYCDARSLRRHLENHHNQTPEQIASAIQAVASNATAIIAAAAASNSASLRSTTPQDLVSSSLPVTQGGGQSQDGNGCSDFSTPQYSDNSTTPLTSPSYSNQQQTSAFFQFDQQTTNSVTTHQDTSVTLQSQIKEDVQRPQTITIQPQVIQAEQQQQTLQQGRQQALQQEQQQTLPTGLQALQSNSQQTLSSGLQQALQTNPQQTLQPGLQQALQANSQQSLQQALQSNPQQTLQQANLEQTLQTGLDQTLQVSTQQALQQSGLEQALQAVPQQRLQQSELEQRQWQEQIQQQILKLNTLAAAATAQTSDPQSPQARNGNQSPGYLQQVSPISPVVPTSPVQTRPAWHSNDKHTGDDILKPVVCSICDRRFKNIPALNGHMRLHGGYFKKETKDGEKKTKKSSAARDSSGAKAKTTESADLASITQAFQLDVMSPTTPVQTTASGFGSQLQSPVTPDIAVPDVTQTVIQHFQQQQQQQQIQKGSENNSACEQQIQLQQLQQQEQRLQLQLQQQIQQLRLEQQQLQHHLQQQKQQQQEQQIQQEQQLQHQIQQQIQQLQLEQQQLHQHLEQQIQQQKLKHIQDQQQTHFQELLQPVPISSQITQPAELQRQVSVESVDYQFQSPQEIPQHMSAQLHLQQLARQQQQQQQQGQRDVTPQLDLALADPQIQLSLQQSSQPVIQIQSPPPVSLSSMSIQTNLQSTIAQIPQFALQTPNHQQENQTTFVSPVHLATSQMTLVTTTADNQELSVAQLLSGIDDLPDSVVSSVFQSQPLQTISHLDSNASIVSSGQHVITHSATSSGIKEDPEFEGQTTLSAGFASSAVLSGGGVDSLGNNVSKSVKNNLIEQTTNGTYTKAAESNPFSFPVVDSLGAVKNGSTTGSNMDNVENSVVLGSEHLGVVNNCESLQVNSDTSLHLSKLEHKSIQNRHKELKRRLSVGSEYDFVKRSYPISGNPHNLAKGSVPNTYVKPSPSSTGGKSEGQNPGHSSGHSRPRMRSKSGDDYNLMRSRSEDHNFMRPRSRTEDSLWRIKSHSEDLWDRPLSKSDGAGLFRNPNTLTSPIKMKRKHRPAPLFIPPHMNNCGFQSRLRSPRITHVEGRGNTPPPYTPPPMLSPIRSGSGLFCSIGGYKPVTPQSAPITPRRLLSTGSGGGMLAWKQESIPESEILPDQEIEQRAPETDVEPHVNIGSSYQAEIPLFNSNKLNALRTVSREDLIWDATGRGDNSDEELQYYQELACSAVVHGNGCNMEYALHLLQLAKGNLKNAILMLMSGPAPLPKNHTLSNYTYQESDLWTTEEIEKYQQALMSCDKDFFTISKEVGTKSVGQCVEFYYLWKKVCPDEHKRLRIVRRKRQQEELYNLRSRQQQEQQQQQQQLQTEVEAGDSDSNSSSSLEEEDQMEKEEEDHSSSSVTVSPSPYFPCDYPECNASFASRQALNAHTRIHGGSSKNSSPSSSIENRGPGRPSKPPPQKSPVPPDPSGDTYPCKLCGRVFYKVKSRNAHMKIHRLAEAERKPKNNIDLTSANKAATSAAPKNRIDFSPMNSSKIVATGSPNG